MPRTTGSPNPSRTPSILVTGATGNLGREIVRRLHERGARPRCLVRTPEARNLPAGVERVAGDLTDRSAVRAALAGVDTVLVMWPLLDSAPARGLVAELAAAAPRGPPVVHVSSTAVDDTAARQSDPVLQVHADMEGLLRRAGLRPVVLRSDTLASNARGWAAQLRERDVVSGPDVARTAVVDERDVADAAATVLRAPDAHAGRGPYLLTGPEALGRARQVELLGAALGRPLRFEALPTDLARARMRADGRPAPLVEALLAASERRPGSDLVTGDVEHLTGRRAGTFAQWARDHAADFG